MSLPSFAFLGRKRSGKDTSADFVCAELDKRQIPYEKIAFAGVMKKACAAMFDVPEEMFHDQSIKEVKCIHGHRFSPRELLIWYGEMMMDKCGGAGFFVDIAMRKINKAKEEGKVAIVTDLRTPIETYAMMNAGVTVFGIDRESHLGPLPADAHFTESGVPVSMSILKAAKYDKYHAIDNNGTLSDTRAQLEYSLLPSFRIY